MLPPAVAAAAVFVGSALALEGSDRLLLFGDEFHSLRHLGQPFAELFARFGIDGSGGALLVLQKLAVDLLGPTPRAFRMPAILGAVGALLLMYPTGARLVGRVPAAVATAALACNSLHVYYSHFGRTFSLTLFLGLGLVYSLTRAMDRAGPRPLWYAAVALFAGLLPYAHLTAVAFSIAVCVAAFSALALRADAGRHPAWLLGAVCAGAALCFALYGPAWDPLWKFIGYESGHGDAAEVLSLDAFTLLAGSRAAAIAWLVATPIAAAWWLWRDGGEAVVPVVASVAMPIGLLLARPMGDAYATARYLLVGLPYVLMLLAWGVEALVRRAGAGGNAAVPLALGCGLALVGIGAATGPLAVRTVAAGEFGASKFRLMALPAFDARWPGEPGFYARVAKRKGPLRIIEAPTLTDHSVALYRNYALRHGHEVLFGAVADELPRETEGGSVHISRVDATHADYLIVHRDVASEVDRYWRYVYRDVWRPEESPELAGFMEAHREFSVQPPASAESLVQKLLRRLGKPVYADRDIVVWKLIPADASK